MPVRHGVHRRQLVCRAGNSGTVIGRAHMVLVGLGDFPALIAHDRQTHPCPAIGLLRFRIPLRCDVRRDHVPPCPCRADRTVQRRRPRSARVADGHCAPNRGIPSGIDLRSPSRHPDILGGDDLLIQDVDRLMQRCPGLEVHLDTALGRDVSLGELKERHDAVLLTIGAWWGKPMGIPGEEDERVVDGVGFLRRVNAGERPEMPETVVVVGGGDVAMDACRVAKRLPGCRHVKVIYRRGPGAFGGSTIVMAMQHGQRAAYYLRHFLEGNRDPLPYRTPYRTRRVPVAQDLMWEKFPIQEPVFCGLGERPAEFPEIELTYDTNTARAEAARCYRCDAETGSADYSVQHREDIFSMARTDPQDAPKLEAMLDRRLRLRENPFPQERPACLDDLVFLPANLSRLVIDPYREACKIGWRLGERLELDIPFFVAGFDAASEELKAPIDRGVVAAGAAYLGATRPGPNAPWLQLCEPGRDAPSHDAAGVVYRVGERWHPMPTARVRAEQLLGLLLASRRGLEDAIVYALERGFDLLVLDGTGALGGEWPELRAAPDLALVRDTIAILRRLKKEEMIDIAWFGGARSGTDAAKLVGLGVNAIGYGVAVALALGGEITQTGVRFAPDRNEEERTSAVVNILEANAGEASMMARCAGKTRLHNIEPEDLRSVTRATAAATGIPLTGTRAA